METFLIYQLKVAVLAAVLALLYKLLLGRQTFHGFNRIMLLLIAAASVTLPLVRIESLKIRTSETRRPVTSLTSVKSVARTPQADTVTMTPDAMSSEPSSNTAYAAVGPVEETSQAKAAMDSQPVKTDNDTPLWVICLLVAYVFGLVWFIIMYVRSLGTVKRLIEEGRYTDRREGCDLIESEGVSQPMNWMRYIVMPRQWLESKEQSMVWQHEYLHASRFHSLDLLLADVLWAMQWFNPAMKMLHGEIELIHEFEADRAVLDSGTDAYSYKMMLVTAVASAQGIKMGNWLKKTKLKNRIDMMERKESNRWNMLRAIFIPVVAFAFLFANAQTVAAQDQEFHWPVFEDGKVWLFKDGSAKVLTFDHVQASMKADQVAKYLKDYQGYRTTRMTLMYMYPIESLADAQPLAEQLLKVGVRVNVANNEEMLERMTMPEFRVVRIYGPVEDDGEYIFEMICNVHEDRLSHVYHGMPYKYKDLSVKGDAKLMLKWIDLFDGHGLAVYPSPDMPLKDLQTFADAAWKRGIEQVSVVQKTLDDGVIITLIPQDTRLSKEYGGTTVNEAVDRMNLVDTENAHVIEHPRFTYNPNPDFDNIVKIIRNDRMTAVVKYAHQGPDLWITRSWSDGMLKCDGKEYRQIGAYGLKGFEQKYYWSPDDGRFVIIDYYPVLPADAKVVDLCDSEGNAEIRNLQVSNDIPEGFYEQFKTLNIGSVYKLETLPKDIPDGGWDNFEVTQIEFTGNATTVRCDMTLCQPHSFPGYVNDFKMVLADGTELLPTRVDGVPVGEEFGRHGDFVSTHFELVFPKLDPELFWNRDSVIMLHGNICHEPVQVELLHQVSPIDIVRKSIESIPEGKYYASVLVAAETSDDEMGRNFQEYKLEFNVDKNGSVTVKGGGKQYLKEGNYMQSSYGIDNREGMMNSTVIGLTMKGKETKYSISAFFAGDRMLQITLDPLSEDNGDGKPEYVILIPKQ